MRARQDADPALGRRDFLKRLGLPSEGRSSWIRIPDDAALRRGRL